MLALCKRHKWKERVKVSKCRKFGDLTSKTVVLVKFLKTRNFKKRMYQNFVLGGHTMPSQPRSFIFFLFSFFLFFFNCFYFVSFSLQYVFTQSNQKKSNGKKYYRSKLNKIIMLIITEDITTIFS